MECLRGAWGGQSVPMSSTGRPHRWSGVPCSQPTACCELAGVRPSCFKGGGAAAAEGPTNQLSQSLLPRQGLGGAQAGSPRDYWVGPEAPGTDPAGSQGSSTLALPRTTSGGSVLLGPPGPAGPALGPSPASLLQTVPNGLKRMLRARSVHGRTAGHPGSQLPLLPRAARRHRKRSRASRGWSQEGGGGQWWDQQPPSMGGLPWSSEGCGSRPRVPEERGGAEG